MKKHLITLAVLAILAPATAMAQPAGNTDNDGGIIEATKNVIEKVVNKVTGADKKAEESSDKGKKDKGDKGAKGRENAIDQIDKNIEKHGGSHPGLENARRNVTKQKQKDVNDIDGDGDTEELIDVIVEEITGGMAEEAKKEVEDIGGVDNGRPGNGNKGSDKSKGKPH